VGGDDFVSGNISIVDVDDITGDGTLMLSVDGTAVDSATGLSVTDTYGLFTMDASGEWSYQLDNSLQSVQQLDDGESVLLTFSVGVKDDDGASADTKVEVLIHGENDVPVVEIPQDKQKYESTVSDPILVAPNATISDIDDPFIESMKIEVTNFDATQDQILIDPSFPVPAGMTISISGSQITITSDSPNTVTQAQYQEVLRALQYVNFAPVPNGPDRVFDVYVNDGEDDSKIATTKICIASPVSRGSSILQGFRFANESDLESAFGLIEYEEDEKTAPLLPLAPLFSGVATPGSVVKVKIVGASGETALAGEVSVVADAGGNWLADFHDLEMSSKPYFVIVEQVAPAWDADKAGDQRSVNVFLSPAINQG
ncbi:MAG: VCBS domain-containing protein, partial [Verrucomicrobiota bacterium]